MLREGATLLDGTIGGGGHAALAAQTFRESISIIGLDMDEEALVRSEEALKPFTSKFVLKHENFRNLDKVLDELGQPLVDAIILDLGLSSNQLELSERGFSFKQNEPLLMTFKKEVGESDITAREIVNEWAEESIADIIYGYGEEQFSRRIAKAIVEGRKEKPIETTDDLVEIIKKGTPFWYHFRKSHPATKTFQALRIAVNDELQALQQGMEMGFERLNKDGRMAIISFHSLEDRLVKHFYRKQYDLGLAEITKKPIVPDEEEVKENPRSRSSKLRIIKKK